MITEVSFVVTLHGLQADDQRAVDALRERIRMVVRESVRAEDGVEIEQAAMCEWLGTDEEGEVTKVAEYGIWGYV